MSYFQNNTGQTPSVVRAGVIGALFATAITSLPAYALEGPQIQQSLSPGIYHSGLVGATTGQFTAPADLSTSVKKLPSLEDQVSGLYSKIFYNEVALDSESVKLYFDNSWDMYAE